MAKDNSAQVAQLFNEIRDQRDAAIAERARYGDAMTERLAGVEAERDEAEADLARTEDLLGIAQDERDAARTERDEARSDYRLLIERVKAVMPYAINAAAWVTLLVTIGIEPEDMHFSK